MYSFLESASGLKALQLTCNDVLTAAQAGFLMSHTCAREVSIAGWHMPGHFPTALAHLRVQFPDDEQIRLDPSIHADNKIVDLRTPNALIYFLACQQRLASLTLDFMGSFVRVTCPISLPELDLCIGFGVGCSVDLGWLTCQPYRCLELRIHFQPCSSFEKHKALITYLQPLSISRLTLYFSSFLPAETQALWQQVTVSQHCSLHVQNVFDVGIGQVHALRAFPRCPHILIHAPNSDNPVGLDVLWPAVTGQPGRVSFHLGSRQALWFSNSRPMSAELEAQPWQLVVHSAKEVRGLHGAQHRGGMQYLQTRAAQLAGWTLA